FAERMAAFKAQLENIGLDLFKAAAPAIQALMNALIPLVKILPAITKWFTSTPNLVAMAAIGFVALSIAINVYTANLIAAAAAAWAAIAPILPFIAAAAALGAAVYALAGGFKKSTETRIKELEVEKKSIESKKNLLEANVKEKEKTIEIGEALLKLVKTKGEAATKTKEYKTSLDEAKKAYPGVISDTATLDENMKNLQLSVDGAKRSIEGQIGKLDKLTTSLRAAADAIDIINLKNKLTEAQQIISEIFVSSGAAYKMSTEEATQFQKNVSDILKNVWTTWEEGPEFIAGTTSFMRGAIGNLIENLERYDKKQVASTGIATILNEALNIQIGRWKIYGKGIADVNSDLSKLDPTLDKTTGNLKTQAESLEYLLKMLAASNLGFTETGEKTKSLGDKYDSTAQETQNLADKTKAFNAEMERLKILFGIIESKELSFSQLIDKMATLKLSMAGTTTVTGENVQATQEQIDKYKELGIQAGIVKKAEEDHKKAVDELTKSYEKAKSVEVDWFETIAQETIEANKKMENDAKKFADTTGQIFAGLGEALGGAFTGKEGAMKDFLKQLIGTVRAAVNMLLIQGLAGEIGTNPISWATFGTAAFASFAIKVVALNALLSAAEGLIGAEEGGLITKGYNKRVGRTDIIPMMVAEKEYIMPAMQTKKNLPYLEYMKQGKDISDLFVNKQGILEQGSKIQNVNYPNMQLIAEMQRSNSYLSDIRDNTGKRYKVVIDDHREIKVKEIESWRL
ncbi:MAG: hypothetical protein KJ915_03095, partial [Candidatus Omnitrophica bacterium]|nr:hypothetical protein [Candidatus Omnitrophota bacterium]